jgi:hypothetical protein
MAAPGNWSYWAEGTRKHRDLTGRYAGSDEPYKIDGSLTVEPAEGRRQRTLGKTHGFRYFTVRDATRTFGTAITLEELTLWGDDWIDTERTFRMPPGAVEVPAKGDWGRPWSYGATSTDGATRIEVTSRVDGTDILDLPSRADPHTSVHCVVIVTTIQASGDRTLKATRTMWWAVDYGVWAKVHERVTGTTSSGESIDVTSDGRLSQADAFAESLNHQVAPDEDGDGVPDSADNP